MGYLESFGALGPDGNPTEAAIERAITLHEEFSKNGKLSLPFPCVPQVEPNPNPPDLRDKEKYKEWHDRWMNGTYKSILKTLEGQQNVACPVYDPTGIAAKLNLPTPDLDLLSIVSSFAVPPAALPILLNIKPNDIPSFLSKLPGLISPPKIPIPEFPPLPALPDYALNLPNKPDLPGLPGILFGGLGVPGFPSREGFDLALFTSIPKLFSSIIEEVINPTWWLDFTPAKIFELTCKASYKIMPQPQTSYPVSFQANVAMITTLTSEAMAAKVVGEVIAGNTLLRIMGEKKGYLAKKTQPTAKDAEALLNNLYRLQSNEINLAILFPQREYSYGDQLPLDMIQSLATHMYEEKSYRKSSNEESVTLEIGNITGQDKSLGWRHNPWSKSHGGGSFDSAYPMRDSSGVWISGVSNNKVTEGDAIGETGLSPFRHGGNAAIPYKIDGKLAHDFPAMYEMGRYVFFDWFMQLAKEGRLVSLNGQKKAPIPLRTILVGEIIFKEFDKWGKSNKGANWNQQPSYPDNVEKTGYFMFTPQPAHEDHMHWAINRTTVDVTETNKRGVIIYKASGVAESSYRYTVVNKKTDDEKIYKARI